jgi:hypothetical protein
MRQSSSRAGKPCSGHRGRGVWRVLAMDDEKLRKEAEKIINEVCDNLEEITGDPVKRPKVVLIDDI